MTYEDEMKNIILRNITIPEGVVKVELLNPDEYLTKEGLEKALSSLKIIEQGFDKLTDDQKEGFEKAKKNLGKLTKKTVVDKNGKRTTVWVNQPEK